MRYNILLSLLFLIGCGSNISQGVLRHCGSPCPHLAPKTIADETLLSTYRASVLGTDLSRPAKLIAAKALQDFLHNANPHETRHWSATTHEISQEPETTFGPSIFALNPEDISQKEETEEAGTSRTVSGTFSFPPHSFSVQGKTNCLTYIQTLTFLDRPPLAAQGTACQEISGIWRIVEEIPIRKNPL